MNNPKSRYGYMILYDDGGPAVFSGEQYVTAGEAFAAAEPKLERTGLERAGKIVIIDNRTEFTREFLESRGESTAWLDR